MKQWNYLEVLKSFKNVWNFPNLGITEVVLLHCHIVNNSYQRSSSVWYTFVPNNLFSQLSDVLSTNLVSFKTFDSEFSNIELWFTNQNSNPLEIEDKINSNLVIN